MAPSEIVLKEEARKQELYLERLVWREANSSWAYYNHRTGFLRLDPMFRHTPDEVLRGVVQSYSIDGKAWNEVVAPWLSKVREEELKARKQYGRCVAHEVGHALVAASLGVGLRTLLLHGDGSGHIRHDPVPEEEHEALIAAAGAAAEFLIYGEGEPCNGDLRIVKKVVDVIPSLHLMHASERYTGAEYIDDLIEECKVILVVNEGIFESAYDHIMHLSDDGRKRVLFRRRTLASLFSGVERY